MGEDAPSGSARVRFSLLCSGSPPGYPRPCALSRAVWPVVRGFSNPAKIRREGRLPRTPRPLVYATDRLTGESPSAPLGATPETQGGSEGPTKGIGRPGLQLLSTIPPLHNAWVVLNMKPDIRW